MTTLVQILYQYFPFQVWQEWGTSVFKYYIIFLKRVLGVWHRKLRGAIQATKYGSVSRFKHKFKQNVFLLFLFCCHRAEEIHKDSTKKKPPKKQIFQYGLLLV